MQIVSCIADWEWLKGLAKIEDPVTGFDLCVTMDERDSVGIVLLSELGHDLESLEESEEVLGFHCCVGLLQ